MSYNNTPLKSEAIFLNEYNKSATVSFNTTNKNLKQDQSNDFDMKYLEPKMTPSKASHGTFWVQVTSRSAFSKRMPLKSKKQDAKVKPASQVEVVEENQKAS